MNVVIIGAGEVGSTIAALLAENHDVTVIELDSDRVDDLTYNLGVLAIEGDGTDPTVLRDSDAQNADLFIASTDIDETNIVSCGTVKALGNPFTIARVKRPQFLDTWRHQEGAFGVDFMVSTDLLTAKELVAAAGLPTARDVGTFADELVQMAEFEIIADSPLTDQTVAEADTFETLTFAAIIRDEELVIPSGQTMIRSGDDVVVIGRQGAIR